MRSQIKLGKVFGIQLGVHYSWFLIALLIVFSLTGNFGIQHPDWPKSLVVGLAITTAILFFISLLLHELSHSVVAKSHGIPVREITLFALGGVSQLEGESPNAPTEFWMAFAGPLTSLVIGFLCLGGVRLMDQPTDPLGTMFSWLGYINLSLAVFNMLPGYPLDGGRVLRAAIWWKTGSIERATRIAARTGQIVAGIFIALGIVNFFSGAGLGGLWIAFIGWFLLQAAGESYTQLGLKRVLGRVRVGDIMSRDCPTVDGNETIQDFVDHELLRTGRRCFAVVDQGALAGIVTPHEIREISRTEWNTAHLHDVMRPIDSIHSVSPDTALNDALELISRENLNQLPVVSNGTFVGMISRGDILRYLQTMSEIGGPNEPNAEARRTTVPPHTIHPHTAR